MTIGVKSLAIGALALGTLVLVLWKGVLDGERFAHLSAASAFAIGVFASVGGALVAWSARPAAASRLALGLRGRRPVLEADAAGVRELPAVVQRGLLIGVFGCLALATFTNDATARIAAAPGEVGKPSRAEYCQPEVAKQPAAAAPAPEPPQPVEDEAGCALVKRAFQLGYAKSLGSCAPKQAQVKAPEAQKAAKQEVCERRQLDEPFTHFAWRRVGEALAGASPVDATSERVATFQIRVDHAGDLLADIKHAITGTPHASHHLWVNLPDPHPRGVVSALVTGKEPCTARFEHLELWPAWMASTPPSVVLEHAVGQLLFATRFGTPASCSDYTIHWGAPDDACAQLAANPARFLAASDALEPVRGVLDRRARQLAIRRLADELGHAQTLPQPPEARAVVSLNCLVVGGTGAMVARDVTFDGQALALREVHVRAIRPSGAGPVELYVALGFLLSGKAYAGPAQTTVNVEPPGAVDANAFPLLALEPLVDADPFAAEGARAALDRPELAEVYPYEQHLFAFIDAFRRVYLPQRGRL